MKMVDGWQRAWRWYSVQVMLFLGLLPMIWAEVPEEVKAMVPVEWRPWIALLVAIGGIVLRLRPQAPK